MNFATHHPSPQKGQTLRALEPILTPRPELSTWSNLGVVDSPLNTCTCHDWTEHVSCLHLLWGWTSPLVLPPCAAVFASGASASSVVAPKLAHCLPPPCLARGHHCIVVWFPSCILVYLSPAHPYPSLQRKGKNLCLPCFLIPVQDAVSQRRSKGLEQGQEQSGFMWFSLATGTPLDCSLLLPSRELLCTICSSQQAGMSSALKLEITQPP